MIRASAVLAAVLFLGVALVSVELSAEDYYQREVWCYSGGHLFWHDVCEECHMTVGGVVQGVDTDGQKFEVAGDCLLIPVGYDPGAR